MYDRWLEKQAQQALSRNDFRRAMEVSAKLLTREPDSAAALRVAAESSRKLGLLEQAIQYLRQLDALGELTATECFQLGDLWLITGRAGDAELRLTQALSIDPDLTAARLRLTHLLSVQCRTSEASAQRYYLLRRKVWCQEDLFFLAKPDDLTESPDLEFFLQHDPENPYLYLARARHAKLLNKPAEAAKWVDQALQIQPDLIDGHADRGLLLLEQPFSREAFHDWGRDLPDHADQHPDVWVVRGMWAKAEGDLWGAARCFGEALTRDPVHRVATYQLSMVLAAVGKESLAAELSKRVTLMDELTRAVDDVYGSPDSGQHWWRAAEALEGLGRLHEAAAWYHTLAGIDRGRSGAADRARALASRITRDSPIVIDESNTMLKMALTEYPLPTLATRSTTAPPTPRSDLAAIHFSDVSRSLALDFAFVGADLPVRRPRRLFELFGAGVAVLDFDLDGWPDIYLAQGSRSLTAVSAPPDGDNDPLLDQLYWNLGGEEFRCVTEQAGIGEDRFSQGVTVGDLNNDGFPDLLVANVGENRLYQNNGDGTFADVSAIAGISGSHWTTSCVLADLNGDAWPDIYEVNYLGGQEVFEVLCGDRQLSGRSCRPRDFPSEPDRFFLSLGDGRFSEQTTEAGVVAPDGKGLGVVVADFDGSGQLSLFVANDTTANHFYVNRASRGVGPDFEERAGLTGLAFDRNGLTQACMGVAVDDVDGDGRLDLFVTNFHSEPNMLYRNLGKHTFEDASRASGLHLPSLPFLGFGTQFLDADLDGDPDLVVTNGHIADETHLGAEFQMVPQFFRNQAGHFVEANTEEMGDYFRRKLLGRALARLDFNRDGLEDFVVTHLDAPVALLQNQTPEHGHFLSVKLVGTEVDRDAIGTTIRITTSTGISRVRQLTAGDGYACSNQRQLVFGLGQDMAVSKIVVQWLSGTIQQFDGIGVDRQWIFVEGRADAVEVRR